MGQTGLRHRPLRPRRPPGLADHAGIGDQRGDWLDPSTGAVPFAKYAADRLDQRQLSPKTAQLYELLLCLNLAPAFGEMIISDSRQEHVRAWHAAELKTGPKQQYWQQTARALDCAGAQQH
jgi:hypothetical protein